MYCVTKPYGHSTSATTFSPMLTQTGSDQGSGRTAVNVGYN